MWAKEHTDWAEAITPSLNFRNSWNYSEGQSPSAICLLIINFQILAGRGVILTILLEYFYHVYSLKWKSDFKFHLNIGR